MVGIRAVPVRADVSYLLSLIETQLLIALILTIESHGTPSSFIKLVYSKTSMFKENDVVLHLGSL